MGTSDSLSDRQLSVVGSTRRCHGWFSPFRALRHRNYRLFFCGQIVSLAGSWMQLAALMWLAFQLTGTSRWPAIVAAAQMVPGILLGVWGGVLADRLPRRRLVFCTQFSLMILAFLLAGFVFTCTETVWNLFAISLAIGVVNAVDLPARLAFLVEMVGKDDLVNAVGLNSLTFNLARFAGPALLPWLLPLGGPELCFCLNGLSFLAVLVALAMMRLAPPVVRQPKTDGWAALGEGFRFVVRHPVLRLLLVLTTAMAIFGWPVLALLPALAKRRLGSGQEGFSSLLSSVGVGALLAAFLVAACGSYARRWLFIGAGVSLSASAFLGLSFVTGLSGAMLCAAMIGAGLILFFATSQASFQLSATDRNRGRVMGIYALILTGAQPLGNLLTGPAADRWGEPFVLRLQGAGIFCVAVLVLTLRLRHQRAKAMSDDDGPITLPFPTHRRRRRAA